MQRSQMKTRRWMLVGAAAAAVLIWRGRELLWLAAEQLFLGMVTALAALPVMKKLEKKLSGGVSAALAIAALYAVLAAALFWLVPALAAQGRQLAAGLPGLWETAEGVLAQAQAWLDARGIVIRSEIQTALLTRMQQALGEAVPRIAETLGGIAGSVGKWLLAPVFGFYFLRDRRIIAEWLSLLLPVSWRGPAVRILREMRRETAGYLRGQLMLSAAVGGLTAVGLLLCGVPSWLALGAVMGMMEWIPYVGPVIGTAVIVLFALPSGLWRMLWALGVAVAVQQAEGSVLSPRLISQTTRLHPAAVILCVVLGGAAAGVTGIVLGVPLLLCVRAALRVLLTCIPAEK